MFPLTNFIFFAKRSATFWTNPIPSDESEEDEDDSDDE